MAEHYLNLYKIQNRKTGQLSDFLTDEELKNVLKYFNLRDTIDDYVFINILYDKEMLVKEMTIKELIEKLQDYDDTCTLTVNGHKFVVDDTVFGSVLDLKEAQED